MKAEQWRQVKPILESALELSPDARPDFLDSVCPDASLRRELDSLLLAHERAGPDALSPGSWLNSDDELRFRLPPGKRIGAYEILEEIAQGGMGAVYRAVRADGQYTQQVALKIVRAELGGEWTSARFRNEQQILASLDHPNIAKILDSGNTAEGLPYFVMELIEGQPITAHCDVHQLPIEARLQIFRTVCSAVHYAHQHLVIHRDIKPTNILVTAGGIPKLLDFGIAKILDPNLLQGAALTSGGFGLMTPEYASPEQLRADPITTATDVYSLGLILFELLTGRQAFRFSNRAPYEIALVVLESEPERPDTLSGDLDTIVMKALRKEPGERYSSVEQFAEDLRRYLEHLPVIARKDTARYRAAKFIQRHKAPVTAAAIVAFALIASLAFALYEAQIARAQRIRAEARFGEVRSLANSLMFDIHDAIKDLPGSTPARKLLVARALGHLDNLAREAGSDASLQRDLAAAYEKLGTVQGNPFGANLGDTPGALVSYRKALSIRGSIQPPGLDDIIALARIERLIAAVHANRGDAGSMQELKNALETAERAARSAPSNPAVLEELQSGYYLIAILLDSFGDYQASAGYLQKELPIVERRSEASPGDRVLRRELGAAEARTGYDLARFGARAEGVVHSLKSIEILKGSSVDGTDAESTRWLGMAHWMLGDILLMTGDAAGALRNYEEQLRLAKMLAAADPANAVVQYDLACSSARAGNAMLLTGDRVGGMGLLDQAAGMFEVQLKRDPAYIEPQFCLAATLMWRSEALEKTGEVVQALDGFRKGLAIWGTAARNYPGTAIEADVALFHGRIGSSLARLGNTEKASEEYQKALRIAEPMASSNPRILEAQYVLADLYRGRGDLWRILAADRAIAVEQRIRHIGDAHTSYELSLRAWHRITNPGARTPVGFSCTDQREVARALAKCDAVLGSLRRNPKALPPGG